MKVSKNAEILKVRGNCENFYFLREILGKARNRKRRICARFWEKSQRRDADDLCANFSCEKLSLTRCAKTIFKRNAARLYAQNASDAPAQAVRVK
jgi:hypothetical protein